MVPLTLLNSLNNKKCYFVTGVINSPIKSSKLQNEQIDTGILNWKDAASSVPTKATKGIILRVK